MTPEQFTELMAHVELISFSAFLISMYYIEKVVRIEKWYGALLWMVILAVVYAFALVIRGG